MQPYEDIHNQLFKNWIKHPINPDGYTRMVIKRILTPKEEQVREKHLQILSQSTIDLRNKNLISRSFAENFYAIVNGIGPKKRKTFKFPFSTTIPGKLHLWCERNGCELIKYLDELDRNVPVKISVTDKKWLVKYFRDAYNNEILDHTVPYIPFESERKPTGRIHECTFAFRKYGGLNFNSKATAISSKIKQLSASRLINPARAKELFRIVNRINPQTMARVLPKSLPEFNITQFKETDDTVEATRELLLEVEKNASTYDLREEDTRDLKALINRFISMITRDFSTTWTLKPTTSSSSS